MNTNAATKWLQSLPKWTRVPVSAAVFVLLPVLVPAVLLLWMARDVWQWAYDIIYDD